MPADLFRILHLSVAGLPYGASDEQEVEEIAAGSLALVARGVYYTTFDVNGVEQVSLYRVPTVAGLDIKARIVYRPATITDPAASPPVPEEFHHAPVHYAASVLYGFDEDNVELHAYHQQAFANFVQDLLELRLSRRQKGPVLMGIQGIHW